VTGWKKISVAGSKGLENVRVMIAQGVALAYGTSLYSDFRHYDGTPNPYVGNGDIRINPTTNKPVGHVMMIIGYNDDLGAGAVLLQNSLGTGWGTAWNPYYDGSGYVWMAYKTFQALAQGHAFYITSIAPADAAGRRGKAAQNQDPQPRRSKLNPRLGRFRALPPTCNCLRGSARIQKVKDDPYRLSVALPRRP
jgi:hypothetical protein